MNFADFVKNKKAADDPAAEAELHFGFTPDGTHEAFVYRCPDDSTLVIVRTDEGHYTMYDRSEYRGTLEDLERALWRHLADDRS